MPYNPGVTDQSGQILAQAINGAVGGVVQNQKAIYASQEALEKELAHLNGTVSFAAEKGILKPEDMDAYITGNITKKRELAVKAGMGYEDMVRSQQQQMQQQRLGMENRRLVMDESMLPANLRRANAVATNAELDSILAERGLNFDPADPSNAGPAAMAGMGYINTAKGPVPVALPNAPLKLTPEEQAQYDEAGQVPLRMSAGQVIPKPKVKEGSVDPADPKTWPKITMADGTEGVGVPNGRGGIELKFPAKGNAAKPATSADAIMISAKVGEAQKLDAEMQKIQSGKGWYGVFDTAGARQEKLQELAQKRSEISAYLGSLGRGDDGRPLGGVPAPAPMPKGTSSANRSAINNALPLPESDGLPPVPDYIEVSSPEEANKLAPGTKFRTPDGRILTRK
jgi:hypothetical protein